MKQPRKAGKFSINKSVIVRLNVHAAKKPHSQARQPTDTGDTTSVITITHF